MQALRTGQLPADLNLGDNEAATTTESAKEDKMVTDDGNVTNDEPEQKNDGPEEMEQVLLIMMFV